MKRPPPNRDEAGPSGVKKRRRISFSEDDDSSRPAAKQSFGATAMNRIYNNACRREKPDELFRKDLISAMKLPDSEQLDEHQFWDMSDPWKPEWEQGVQVPVNSKVVPSSNVRAIREKSKYNFKLPKKLMRTTEDSFFNQEHHVLIDTATKAESVCKYDMDDMDSAWLYAFNERRNYYGLPPIEEEAMERLLEDFETQCSNRFQDLLKTEKGLGIEYDEDINCDVCRAPDCEEGNEMVFCDSCNICVHQACYGITAIPEGSWICKPCSMNVKPNCALCPNLGGAMKSTATGDKWAHVSCALWVPEVSIGCAEKMEPVTKISNIPPSRWALICYICREKGGACIQCSVKQCKTAYHVTCAFENGLEMEMKTTPIDSAEQGVKMQSLCLKHCKPEIAEKSPLNNPEKSPQKSPKKLTPVRKKKEVQKDKIDVEFDEHNARLQKIRSLEAQFHKFVNIKDTATLHRYDIDVVGFFYNYWLLKRKTRFNKPLLITKCDEANLLIKQHENLLYSRLKLFVHLRQDLERVRNLAYMLGRREKMFRSFMRIKREVFEKQMDILRNKSLKLTPKDREEILKARYGTKLFERFYCWDMEEDTTNPKPTNPYAKSYVNNVHTRSRRRTTSQNLSDPVVENCDSESNEMPILVNCVSEENPNQDEVNDKREPPTFTNSRLIKQEVEDSAFEAQTQDRKYSADSKDRSHTNSLLHDALVVNKEPEMPKINSENLSTTRTRRHSSANGSSGDKNSVCLSDKENINGLMPTKAKKTRLQTEGKLQNGNLDLVHPKLEAMEVDVITSDISSLDKRKSFGCDKKNSRYPTRNRRCSSEAVELANGGMSPKDVATHFKLPSPKPDSAMTPMNGNSETSCSSSPETNGQAETPKKKRGRPRKIKIDELIPDVDLSVIKQEVVDIETDSRDVPLPESPVTEDSAFRMSLRHVRENPSPKRPRGRKPKTTMIRIKLEHPEASPLREPNNNGDCSRSSSEWDNPRPSPMSSPEQSGFERIVIRLRKDANGESWKNDSSSSESFRIIHDDENSTAKSENSVSEFPSVIKFSSSDYGHRYPMRERALLPRSAKCTTDGRS
ncbi:hypothetical protein JTE90_009742 [Oedothorax gibbosus]|uniref:PHD finger protein rhinoceros n=1 Tax=Oedothorax gibbosus TaxID=931172 RepID=A0AAV6V7P7_9ARAC|nr:hypothetical protein JTE90_009742 [Oedothorax gibbosus]